MICSFGSCKQDHDLWVKIYHDSGVVPMCKGCAKTESEKYHVSFKDSKEPEDVEDYIVAYDPDIALAEQLIETNELIEQALSQYEGDNQEAFNTVIECTKKINEAISTL